MFVCAQIFTQERFSENNLEKHPHTMVNVNRCDFQYTWILALIVSWELLKVYIQKFNVQQ